MAVRYEVRALYQAPEGFNKGFHPWVEQYELDMLYALDLSKDTKATDSDWRHRLVAEGLAVEIEIEYTDWYDAYLADVQKKVMKCLNRTNSAQQKLTSSLVQ